MNPARGTTTETRAHTDASLDAERASTDGDAARAAGRARRVYDDLIERDRIHADDRLSRFRTRADNALADRRILSPSSGTAVVTERSVADEDRRAERLDMDARIERERQRANVIVEAEREVQQSHRARHEIRRRDTDNQLSAERLGADDTAIALDEARCALGASEDQHAHRRDVFEMVTHDIRNPLAAIAMNAAIIVETTRESETREAAHDIVLAAARMDRLLTDLLDVARIESETFQVVRRSHDVGALLDEVHRSYRTLFEARGMTFSYESPDAALVASFDHDRIVQVLSNLLANAMKFAGPGATVHMRVLPSKDQVELVVSDDGPGIPAKDVTRVFQRFWKSDRDERRGLGLGLFICKKIVEAHHGRIWVESDLGEGATFRFSLPNPETTAELGPTTARYPTSPRLAAPR